MVAEPQQEVVHSSTSMQLIFGNLPPYLMKKNVLCYPVLIHIRHIADFSPDYSSSDGPSSSSSHGDSSHDRHPDRDKGGSGGCGPRMFGFNVRPGCLDGQTHPAAQQETHRTGRRHAGDTARQNAAGNESKPPERKTKTGSSQQKQERPKAKVVKAVWQPKKGSLEKVQPAQNPLRPPTLDQLSKQTKSSLLTSKKKARR